MIHYETGDATAPIGNGPRVIVHVCNDVGAWGAGFVLAVSRRWPGPQEKYLAKERDMVLGDVQFVEVEPELFVANMIAQRGLPSRERRVALDYQALARCLSGVAWLCRKRGASVHMPRIGCGIAGGNWDDVARVIDTALSDVEVFVYDLPDAT